MTENETTVETEAVEVTEEEQQPTFTLEDYIEYKRDVRKQKKLKEQLRNNQKAMRGFGYTYKEINYDV